MKRARFIGLGLLLLVGGAIVIYGFNQYRQVKQLDQQVHNAWAPAEVQFRRRLDLASPEIDGISKNTTGKAHDRAVAMAGARTAYLSAATLKEKLAAANNFNTGLIGLVLLQEQDPQLKSNASFRKLQDAATSTEAALTVECNNFNDAKGALSEFIVVAPRIKFRQFFASLAGVQNGFEPYEPFFKDDAVKNRIRIWGK